MPKRVGQDGAGNTPIYPYEYRELNRTFVSQRDGVKFWAGLIEAHQ
ncbi:hypothetical protein BFV93_3153 [Alteromonas macleodii]|nr:hypothetical protein BFV93_3153 [Alteromonas macleodii]